MRGAAEKGWSGREAVSAPDTIGYVIFALDGRSLQTMLDRAEAQTIITDRFGWVFFGGNDDFLTESNQITGALEKSGNYLSYGGHLYLVSRQTAFRGMFRVYTISDIQSVVASLATVSYTHLDVYKRQQDGRPRRVRNRYRLPA